MVAKRGPRGPILGAKMGPKSIKIRSQKRRAKKEALERLLGRSWVPLGSFWEPRESEISSKSIGFTSKCVKTTFLKTKSLQERSKSQKKAIWVPKPPPGGAQEGAQTDQKGIQKPHRNFHRFFIDLGPKTSRRDFRPAAPGAPPKVFFIE